MRILADENIPRAAVDALRSAGHLVRWVRVEMPGAADEHLLALAEEEALTILTLDKGFGQLAYERRLPAGCGIVLLRPAFDPPGKLAAWIVDVLARRSDWAGHFSVVDQRGIRMRAL